jgi:TetR/AcrR family transcriptional repressor of nem operon
VATTSSRILDVAERLVQTRGFNGFSYADIAEVLRIRKASLHHHFPTKADLAEALVERYHGAFFRALASIEEKSVSARAKLDAYVALYRGVLARKRLCLCGMLAAEYATLPASVRSRVKRFFRQNALWLTALVKAAQQEGVISEGDPAVLAGQIVATLEGVMIVSRAQGGVAHFDRVASGLLQGISARVGGVRTDEYRPASD